LNSKETATFLFIVQWHLVTYSVSLKPSPVWNRGVYRLFFYKIFALQYTQQFYIALIYTFLSFSGPNDPVLNVMNKIIIWLSTIKTKKYIIQMLFIPVDNTLYLHLTQFYNLITEAAIWIFIRHIFGWKFWYSHVSVAETWNTFKWICYWHYIWMCKYTEWKCSYIVHEHVTFGMWIWKIGFIPDDSQHKKFTVGAGCDSMTNCTTDLKMLWRAPFKHLSWIYFETISMSWD
jgi:hypothetical protein